jgi:ABC-type glycerol-3-phosphate transport system substrate-binding protein
MGAEKDEQQFRRFSQDHPRITVQVDMVGGSADPKEKFIVQAAAGMPPHLLQNDYGVWMDMARRWGVLTR